jgi:hypothetical protein|uniref:cDNA FLJ43465 fis, clone OCBBF2036476 n=1 Tax=Homo sapiens TaxID=9606 RepID=Q6ZUQ1_HUMAN|nr:unnamed protein product [Homo sapiens]
MGCARRHAGPRGSPVKGSGGLDSLWAWGGVVSLCWLSYRWWPVSPGSGCSHVPAPTLPARDRPHQDPGAAPASARLSPRSQVRPQPLRHASGSSCCTCSSPCASTLLSGFLPLATGRVCVKPQGLQKLEVPLSGRIMHCTRGIKGGDRKNYGCCDTSPTAPRLAATATRRDFSVASRGVGQRWSLVTFSLGPAPGLSSLGNSTSLSTPLEGLTMRGAQTGGITTWFGLYHSPRDKARQTPLHIRSEFELWLHDTDT